jgi:DNA-binding response OmpR family regulator
MIDSQMPIQRILIAEDNHFTLDIVSRSLQKEGFEVLTAMTGQEALDVIGRHGLPHLALVDIHMPVMDGLTLCKAIHQFSDLPIIILTAVDDEDVIVKSIDQFAEDYMVKPFKPRELVARVRRVLRRIGDFAYTLAPVVVVDERLCVNFPNRQVILEGEEVMMTPIETKLLYILMRNAGRIVTTDFLLRRLWPLDEVHENRLRVHVHNLRKKIERDVSEPFYILSERGMGYRFPENAKM